MERRKCRPTGELRRRNLRYRSRRKRKSGQLSATAGSVLCLIVIVFFLFSSVRQLFVYTVENAWIQGGVDHSGAVGNLNQLYSANAILLDRDSGNILAEKRAGKKIYPASLTKIMTALLLVEYTEDPDEVTEIPEYFFPELYAEEASTAGFWPGETVCLRDLLYGILLPSGAECCRTAADWIAGSEEAFVDLMNEKAKEVGMKHTHFSNSTGLQDADHYSTVEDISVLLRYALEKEAFREAFTCSQYSVPPSDQHPEGFTFYSTLSPFQEQMQIPGGKILGGKTGYTEEAGLCLASLGQAGKKEYILVTAKAEGSHDTEPFHVLDAVKVYGSLAGQ